MLEPVRDDVEVGILIKGVERKPQTKTLRERNLFLNGFARMNLLADSFAFEILREILRHQVTTIRSGVYQHIVRCAGNRAVQYDLQRLERGVSGVKRKIIAVDDETFRAAFKQFDDVGQVDQVAFFHLDDT